MPPILNHHKLRFTFIFLGIFATSIAQFAYVSDDLTHSMDIPFTIVSGASILEALLLAMLSWALSASPYKKFSQILDAATAALMGVALLTISCLYIIETKNLQAYCIRSTHLSSRCQEPLIKFCAAAMSIVNGFFHFLFLIALRQSIQRKSKERCDEMNCVG